MQEGFQASAYTFNMPLKKQLRRKRQLWSVWGHWTHSLDQLGLGLRTLLHRGLKSGIYFAVMCRVWKGLQRACRPQGRSALPSEGALQGGPVPHGPSCRGVPAITSLSRVGRRRTDEGGCSLPPSRGCGESLACLSSHCITPASASMWPSPRYMAVSCPLFIRTPVSGSSCVVLVH